MNPGQITYEMLLEAYKNAHLRMLQNPSVTYKVADDGVVILFNEDGSIAGYTSKEILDQLIKGSPTK